MIDRYDHKILEYDAMPIPKEKHLKRNITSTSRVVTDGSNPPDADLGYQTAIHSKTNRSNIAEQPPIRPNFSSPFHPSSFSPPLVNRYADQMRCNGL